MTNREDALRLAVGLLRKLAHATPTETEEYWKMVNAADTLESWLEEMQPPALEVNVSDSIDFATTMG